MDGNEVASCLLTLAYAYEKARNIRGRSHSAKPRPLCSGQQPRKPALARPISVIKSQPDFRSARGGRVKLPCRRYRECAP